MWNRYSSKVCRILLPLDLDQENMAPFRYILKHQGLDLISEGGEVEIIDHTDDPHVPAPFVDLFSRRDLRVRPCGPRFH